jgi:hypothetical protein
MKLRNAVGFCAMDRKSGRGLPHSTTLTRVIESASFRQVLKCGSPFPLGTSEGERLVAHHLA